MRMPPRHPEIFSALGSLGGPPPYVAANRWRALSVALTLGDMKTAQAIYNSDWSMTQINNYLAAHTDVVVDPALQAQWAAAHDHGLSWAEVIGGFLLIVGAGAAIVGAGGGGAAGATVSSETLAPFVPSVSMIPTAGAIASTAASTAAMTTLAEVSITSSIATGFTAAQIAGGALAVAGTVSALTASGGAPVSEIAPQTDVLQEVQITATPAATNSLIDAVAAATVVAAPVAMTMESAPPVVDTYTLDEVQVTARPPTAGSNSLVDTIAASVALGAGAAAAVSGATPNANIPQSQNPVLKAINSVSDAAKSLNSGLDMYGTLKTLTAGGSKSITGAAIDPNVGISPGLSNGAKTGLLLAGALLLALVASDMKKGKGTGH